MGLSHLVRAETTDAPWDRGTGLFWVSLQVVLDSVAPDCVACSWEDRTS